jgi:hypothetical protein
VACETTVTNDHSGDDDVVVVNEERGRKQQTSLLREEGDDESCISLFFNCCNSLFSLSVVTLNHSLTDSLCVYDYYCCYHRQ